MEGRRASRWVSIFNALKINGSETQCHRCKRCERWLRNPSFTQTRRVRQWKAGEPPNGHLSSQPQRMQRKVAVTSGVLTDLVAVCAATFVLTASYFNDSFLAWTTIRSRFRAKGKSRAAMQCSLGSGLRQLHCADHARASKHAVTACKEARTCTAAVTGGEGPPGVALQGAGGLFQGGRDNLCREVEILAQMVDAGISQKPAQHHPPESGIEPVVHFVMGTASCRRDCREEQHH